MLSLSCTGTDVGNPVVPTTNVALVAPTFEAGPGLGPYSARVTDAWMVVRDVEFYMGSSCEESEIELDGPFAIDLFSRTLPPAFSSLDPTDTCKVEMRLRSISDLPDGTPPQLDDASIFLAGTWGDGGRFEVRLEGEQELSFDARGEMVGQGFGRYFLTLAAASLFEGLFLSEADVDDDGVVRIEGGKNDALLTAINGRVESAFAIYDDDDDDGELDDDEYDSDDDVLAR